MSGAVRGNVHIRKTPCTRLMRVCATVRAPGAVKIDVQPAFQLPDSDRTFPLLPPRKGRLLIHTAPCFTKAAPIESYHVALSIRASRVNTGVV